LNPYFVKLLKAGKEVVFNSPFRSYVFPKYRYNFTPPQLCFLCQCLEETKNIEGAIFEIGCASGYTTVFLNKYMDAQNIHKDYYAIDTFSGFVAEDIDFEVNNRDKAEQLFTGFQFNKKKWFDGTMQQNEITRVKSIETDINKFDLTKLGLLSFCLLDVDLYRPMQKALPELYQILSPGGIIVVDDCDSTNIRWDGSDQAYKEFMKERNEAILVVHQKLGIIKKPV
jgi:SAM-dependent methyltransferase